MAKNHMKSYSTSLIEMQMKTMKYYLTPIRMATVKKQKVSVGKDVEKLEPCILLMGT